jgi:hypothetical protein
MRAPALLALIATLGVAAPAFADVISCDSSDGESTIEIAVDFTESRDAGEITGVRVSTPHYGLSTYPGESDRPADTLAFADVAFDRIALGLESHNTGPMTLTVDIVRAAVYDGDGGPDREVVVAGVARIGLDSTATLVCTGW